jgi:DMSO/TMAO reductase YedYZ molybdopterin-dependent catalytic subunit
MKKLSRRKLITTGVVATAGASGLVAAAKLGQHYGIIPPDGSGIYGVGATLTYSAQRLLTRHSLAREFSPKEISKEPFANEVAPLGDGFKRHQEASFANWRLTVDGMVTKPASFSLEQIKNFPTRTQITHIACEEGWSYIAQWTGVPLAHILELVEPLPHVKYLVYKSFQPDWWDSIDMADALHPQTIITHGMNGADLPVEFGGPLRMRVPRQLGYKNVKYVTHLTLTDDIKKFGKGLGSASPEAGYSWYAGI